MRKINSIIKRLALAGLMLFAGTSMFAQNIELAPSSRGIKISESSFKGFNSTFSFSNIESELIKTESGDFSVLKMDKTINGGELGGPALPIARELVAVPFGATPVVKVVSYTTTDYQLSDYGIERVYPQQPSYSKDTKVEDMVFQYNENAYQTRALNNAPEVSLNVMGTMRGVQLGALQVEPVSYNPANNTLRVYNDIELEVVFENADIAKTEETLLRTYSPYYDVVYKQLFNTRAIESVYDEHPDIFSAPVHMLVIANRMFEDAIEPWIEWKTKKGFYLKVKYTDEIGESANDITEYITGEYNSQEVPSFVIIVGDEDQVAPSRTSGVDSGRVTDLYYSSVDGDYFTDIYHSRMACETVSEMEALINKILQYEQYTMPDPSYLDNVLLIAGADSYWNPVVGKPTIQYASNYYFNEEHGYEDVHVYLGPQYSGCYTHLSDGVGFANYTAHGSETSWSDPQFTVSNVYSLTNTDKYFWAMGNCCNAADWGYYSTSFGEAMIRAEEKAAFSYIGSCPVTYWWEDYYFGVGATTITNRMPTFEETTMGNYDAQFLEDTYNTIAAVPFVGNLAVAYSHTESGYESAATTRYYFEAYHVLGDASIMPYRSMPSENSVSHLPTVPIGMNFYTVNADPGSYVGISQNGTLYGAGMIGEAGTANIEMTPITSGGDVTIVVTHPNRVPYVATVPAAAMDGPYLAVDSFTPSTIATNQETQISLVIKNVGADATTAGGTVTLSCDADFVTIVDAEGSFNSLAADATVTLENEFVIKVDEGVANGTKFNVTATIESGNDSWEGRMNFTVVAPVIEFKEFVYAGSFVPGETQTVMAKFENKGDYAATNAVVKATSNEYITFAEDTFEIGTIDPSGVGSAIFEVTVSSSCPSTEAIELNFELTADNGVAAEGTGYLRNTCLIEFLLNDSYGDGWNGSTLTVAFDNGDDAQTLDFPSGNNKTHVLEIGSGVNVTVSFNVNGNYWTYECSYSIKYQDGDEIYNSNGEPNSGVNTEFVVNCGGGEPGETYDPVQNLTATVNMDQVTLTWEAAAVKYIVERNGVQVAETEETTFVDSELADGVYTYMVTAVYENGQSMPASVTAEVNTIGLEEMEVMFAIYPNPAKDVININTNAVKYEYQLINGLGQVVISGTSNGAQQINVSDINKGMYFLKVIADGEARINKIVVE